MSEVHRPKHKASAVSDDGRVEIDLDSKLARHLSHVTRLPEEAYELEPPPSYLQSSYDCPLNIVIQVIGSRGDVQPFVALGQALQRAGHRIRLATHDIFSSFVRQAGIEFYPIGGNPEELMALIVYGQEPRLASQNETLREGEIRKKRRMIAEMLSRCWSSCLEPDLDTQEPFVANAIIANPPSFAHVHCAQALGIPVHIMFTMPWTQTQAFPHPLACLRPSKVDKGVANYLSYGLVQFLTWQGLSDVINDFRESLDLDPVPNTEGAFLTETLKVPHTYCWSPALVSKPKDWPEHVDVGGFFFRDVPEYAAPVALQDFLTDGTTPIYIGFGSIIVDNPEALTDTIVEAVRKSGTRAIISAGWSKLGRARRQPESDVFFLNGDCPHEWLFPRVKAVVHHGGAGTTACGLLNGRPTAVIPFFGDQFFWGDMIAQKGAGPVPIRHRKLTVENLSQAINFCLSSEAASNAANIAESMRKENGIAAAVSSFHRHLRPGSLACDVEPRQHALWTCRASGRTIKISGSVAETLIKHGKIKRSELRSYKPLPINISNRRWDPATAVASSLTSTTVDLLSATTSFWTAPNAIRKQAVARNETGKTSIKDMAAMVGGTAMGIPRICGAFGKGLLVDMPLAATEGLRVAPRLYGEEVATLAPINGWKSGSIVAAQVFATNIRDGVVGLYTLPSEGFGREGIAGLSKGVGKGLLGFPAKTGAALIGLFSYPADGMMKSVHATLYSGTRKAIVRAKWLQSWSELQRQPMDDAEVVECLRKFDGLVHEKVEGKKS